MGCGHVEGDEEIKSSVLVFFKPIKVQVQPACLGVELAVGQKIAVAASTIPNPNIHTAPRS